MAEAIYPGANVTLRVTVTDGLTGAAAPPASIACTYQHETQTGPGYLGTATATQDGATHKYKATIVVPRTRAAEGRWHFAFVGAAQVDGTGGGSGEGYFDVSPSAMALPAGP